MWWSRRCGTGVVALVLCAVAWGAQQSAQAAGLVLKGRVVDAGKAEPANGIEAVTVQVYAATPRTPIAEAITDAAGSYEIKLDSPPSGKLMLMISKIGYFARPHPQEVLRAAEMQKTARLAQEAAANDYYRRVRDNAINAGTDLQSFFPAVLSLPNKQKETVFEALRQSDANAYGEFAKADKTFRAAQDIAAKLDPNTSVEVYANVGASGTVLITGAVPSDSDKDALAKAIGKYSGVARVENDLAVQPGVKSFMRPGTTGRSLFDNSGVAERRQGRPGESLQMPAARSERELR